MNGVSRQVNELAVPTGTAMDLLVHRATVLYC